MSGRSSADPADSIDFTRDSVTEVTPHTAMRRALGALADTLAEEVQATSDAIKQSSSKHAFDATVIVVTANASLVETLRASLDLDVFQATSPAAALLAARAPFVRLVVVDRALDGGEAVLAAVPTAVAIDAAAGPEAVARTVEEALHGR